MLPVIICLFHRKVIWSAFLLLLSLGLFLTAVKIKKMSDRGYFLNTLGVLETDPVRMSTVSSLVDDQNVFFDLPVCSFRPYLLILVASSPENFDRRAAIRRTWGRSSLRMLRNNLSTVTMFLVGRSTDSKFLNILVENEKISSGDLVVGDYADTYRNLTLKIIHGARWAHRYCQSSYLLKTDDDCYVNVALLLKFLSRSNKMHKGLYVGRKRSRAKVVRDPKSKWYVSKEQFSPSVYPDYVSGIGYIVSADVLSVFVDETTHYAPFPNEDAFVGTVLRRRGVKPIHSSRFSISSGPWRVCNFLYIFVLHRIPAEYQRKMQALSDMALVECPFTPWDEWD
ncbi:beta-1,3-galactosyltransferase 1-like [Centruroides sculpturatus]|uniref:beta-1,3-galactosyltransferase 1-like n=1 Tax=Centruroides sculpturatus TaxID=218467 RepID=UPI000C6D4D7D|nr:beta-1,3-galactosyltransferase 1-like [Centruroides sculpturatus]